jgi:ATP-binding cassette subfamily B protein
VAAISLVLVFAASGLQIVSPLLTKSAVDRYLVPVPAPSSAPWEPWLSSEPGIGLAQIGALYLAVILLGLAIQYVQGYLMQWTGQQAVFEHLQRLDIAYYDRHPVGRLVTRVTTDVDVLNDLFATGFITAIADILVLLFVLAAMLKLNVGLTLLLLCAAPFVILAIVQFRRAAAESYRQIRVAIARINSYVQERVSGMSVVQLFNREEPSKQEFADINRSHVSAYRKAIIAYGWFFPIIELIGMVAVAALLAYGGFQIHHGTLTLGVLLAFFQYGMRFFRPVQDLSEKYNLLQSAVAASERIFELLDAPVEITPPARPKPLPEGPLEIEFDGVWFAYRDEEWVIQDVSFRVAPGETIAIVGHTGAGKTTLINLLLRFYDVRRGAIRIGGVDLRDLDPRQLRRHFGVVLQDPHLFTGTIEDNIRLGTAWIDQEDLVTAAEQANLLDYIRSLPEGFSHPVRERGSGLSTGQKQLISFARALAHNPKILILDEATSSVDTETEQRLRAALARIVEGRTSFIIAHRLSTIQRADRIFVMHKGQLRETGTHQELLARRGIYWKLYQLQYQEQERVSPQPLVSGD